MEQKIVDHDTKTLRHAGGTCRSGVTRGGRRTGKPSVLRIYALEARRISGQPEDNGRYNETLNDTNTLNNTKYAERTQRH